MVRRQHPPDLLFIHLERTETQATITLPRVLNITIPRSYRYGRLLTVTTKDSTTILMFDRNKASWEAATRLLGTPLTPRIRRAVISDAKTLHGMMIGDESLTKILVALATDIEAHLP